jgi:hypothetical protein
MIKFLLRISLVLATFLVFVPKGQAQNLNNSRINQFSDQQVMQLWQQASENGLSETDAMKLLVKKGLKPNEVSQFKKRLVGLQSSKKSQFSKSSLIQDTTSFLRDSTWVLEVPELKKQSNRYGYEFFSSPNISFEPNLRIATPKTYVLGPDDQLNVTLTGLNETEVMARVNPDSYDGYVWLLNETSGNYKNTGSQLTNDASTDLVVSGNISTGTIKLYGVSN